MAEDYVPPEFGVDGFNCPNCTIWAHQNWYFGTTATTSQRGGGGTRSLPSISASVCARCNHFALWRDKQLLYPQTYVTPRPTADMPPDVKDDYEEAQAIFSQSPRGAAALLRLAIQKLVIALGESGDDLNKDIGNLVKKGLPKLIQKSLDIVRVVGNNAVHPGLIDVEDNPEVAGKLFGLVNLIVETMISQPKKVSELYEALPEGAKEQIARRDKEVASQ